MLNSIIDTILPKARMKWPSTPVSFMRRSTISASFDVRISMNSRLASGSSRSWMLMSLSDRVGVKREIVFLRQPENPDQVDRVMPEDIGRREIDAVVVDDEIVAVG